MKDVIDPINTDDKLFHDGDPSTGSEGTIVTAAWLNDVQGATISTQKEIKNVLADAKLTPDPNKDAQLLAALNVLMGRQTITSMMSAPINGSLAANGYIIIPTTNVNGVKKNVIIQMGTSVINASSGKVTYPIAFPVRTISVVAIKFAAGGRYVTIDVPTKTDFTVYGWVSTGAGNADTFGWVAIGE